MTRAPRRPRDTNQLAKFIVDLSVGDTEEAKPDASKRPDAIERGRKGGLKGGRARAKKLSPLSRSKIAHKAAKARWGKTGG